MAAWWARPAADKGWPGDQARPRGLKPRAAAAAAARRVPSCWQRSSRAAGDRLLSGAGDQAGGCSGLQGGEPRGGTGWYLHLGPMLTGFRSFCSPLALPRQLLQPNNEILRTLAPDYPATRVRNTARPLERVSSASAPQDRFCGPRDPSIHQLSALESPMQPKGGTNVKSAPVWYFH